MPFNPYSIKYLSPSGQNLRKNMIKISLEGFISFKRRVYARYERIYGKRHPGGPPVRK